MLTTQLVEILKTGPKTMQQLYQEMPSVSHRTIKVKMVRPLSRLNVARVKKTPNSKAFHVQLIDPLPKRFEEILQHTERQLNNKKENIKWEFQDNKRFTKLIGNQEFQRKKQ